MAIRILTEAERLTLTAALTRQMGYVIQQMSLAADREDVNELRALLADYDACVALGVLVANPCRLVVQ